MKDEKNHQKKKRKNQNKRRKNKKQEGDDERGSDDSSRSIDTVICSSDESRKSCKDEVELLWPLPEADPD